MCYTAPDNIYWLFSSSAQAIAAFIGFVAAGFFFFHDRIGKEVDRDETLEEIYAEIRKQNYSRLRFLFILTGAAIILSLLSVFLNGYDLGGWNILLHYVTAAVNLLTIFAAISFVIYVVNPDRVKRTTATLIDKEKQTFEPKTGDNVSSVSFISKFVQMESLIRDIAKRYQLTDDTPFSQGRFIPLSEIIKRMGLRELINRNQLEELIYLSKVRNLAVHGNPGKIDERVERELEQITEELNRIK